MQVLTTGESPAGILLVGILLVGILISSSQGAGKGQSSVIPQGCPRVAPDLPGSLGPGPRLCPLGGLGTLLSALGS